MRGTHNANGVCHVAWISVRCAYRCAQQGPGCGAPGLRKAVGKLHFLQVRSRRRRSLASLMTQGPVFLRTRAAIECKAGNGESSGTLCTGHFDPQALVRSGLAPLRAAGDAAVFAYASARVSSRARESARSVCQQTVSKACTQQACGKQGQCVHCVTPERSQAPTSALVERPR